MDPDCAYCLRFGERPRNGVLTQGAVFLATALLAAGSLAAPTHDSAAPSGLSQDSIAAATPRRIVITQAGSPAPKAESAIATDARKVLPDRFREYQTKRYLIFSDADSQWTIAQSENLERAHHQFLRYMRTLGIETQPLRHKLVCILFASRGDYQKFAVQHDRVADPWISGYYAPHHDWIVFYHPESNPSVVDARAALAKMSEHADALDQRLAEAVQAGRATDAGVLKHAAELQRAHLDREQAKVDQFALSVSIATTLHEATHQLLFHTGVQTTRVQYPLWICEGLATTFETDTPNQAFGPADEYAPRRAAFATLLHDGKLLSLRKLVEMTAIPPNDTDTVHVVYHQSYALVSWMARHRSDEFTAFLLAMQKEPQGRTERDRLVDIFEHQFGAIDRVESDWLEYERQNNRRPIVTFDGETDPVRP